MRSLLLLLVTLLFSFTGSSQLDNTIITAGTFFDDGRKGSFSNVNRKLGDNVVGLIEDFTGQYVTYRKITHKDDGTVVNDQDIVPGRGIYRKKGKDYYRLNFDGPVNIRWYGAVPDSKTDNAESISQALKASSFIRIPPGNFAIARSIEINATAQIIGDGPHVSVLSCLNNNIAAFTLGNQPSVKVLSLLTFSNFTIKNGRYALSSVRGTGPQLIIERAHIKNMNFETQLTAGIHMAGSSLLFLVNTLQENAFRYCGTGIVLENVFSANLNHIQLNRFEGTVGGIHISTTNNELSQLTIQKNRFEAIVAKGSRVNPIEILGGNQNISIADNYFEDVPVPVINIDAQQAMAISPTISNNHFSANIAGKTMIRFASQVKSPNITSNVFKPGKAGTKLDFSPHVSEPILQGNFGDVSFLSYPLSFQAVQKGASAQSLEQVFFKRTIAHAGNFTFTIQLPAQGVYTVSVGLADDGDFSLGGVVTYHVAWLRGGAPILASQPILVKLNPNTKGMVLSSPDNNGRIIVSVSKADRNQRTALCYYSIVANLNIDLANVLGEQ